MKISIGPHIQSYTSAFFISEYQQNLISCHSVANIIFYTALYFHDDTVILNCIHRFGSYIFTRHLPPHICHLSLRTQGSRGLSINTFLNGRQQTQCIGIYFHIQSQLNALKMPINFRRFKPLHFTFIELCCRRNKIDIARRGKINSTYTQRERRRREKKGLLLPLRNGTHNGRPAIKNSSISVKRLKVRLNKMFCQCTLHFDRAPASTDLHVVEHMQEPRNLEND